MNSDSKFNPDKDKMHFKIRNRIAAILEDKTSKYFVKLFLFILLYKLGQYTFNLFENIDFFSGIFDGLYAALSSFITVISVKFYSLFYEKIFADSEFCIAINNVKVIQMNPGCTGLLPLFQMFFILIFFPLALKQKLLFFPISLSIIVFASILHYIILIPVAHAFHGSFTIFHDVISRVIFYIFFFINFVLWNRSSEKIANTGNRSVH